jgi:hypothetical protein
MQGVESSVVVAFSVLLAVVRCLDIGESKEQIRLCKSLPLGMETGDTFKLRNSYVIVKGFTWKQCVEICTDGGTTDGGRITLFIGARVTAIGPEGIGSTARHAHVMTLPRQRESPKTTIIQQPYNSSNLVLSPGRGSTPGRTD